MVQRRLLYQDFLVPQQDLPASDLIGGVLQQEVLAVLLEVVLRLPLDKFCVVVDVLLNFEEFLYEFLKGPPVNIPQLSNQNRVKHTQVPQALKHSVRCKHLGRFEAVRLDASYKVAIGGIEFFGKFIHLVEEFGSQELLGGCPALALVCLHVSKDDHL